MITFYTCSDHPDVCEYQLSSCPSCGVALRAGTSLALELSESRKLCDQTRSFIFAAAFSLPVVLLGMGDVVQPLAQRLPLDLRRWLELAFATPVCLWCVRPFYVRAGHAWRSRGVDMSTLVVLAVGATYGFSLLALLVPGIFPQSLREPDGRVALHFDVAAMVVTLVLLGQVLERGVRTQTCTALRGLRDLTARVRRLGKGDADYEVPLDRIQVGDRLRVMPGERVPVDGVVLEGASGVDESVLSGEASLVSKRSGDELIGGTLNTTGSLVMRAQSVGDDTLLACIVERVAAAQHSASPLQLRADAVTRYLVPAVLAFALLTFSLWAAFGSDPGLTRALLGAIGVMIIASPYALALAAPMSIMVAMGRGARAGVLFRSAEEIERLAQIDTLVIDKTGTLTEARPTLAKLIPIGDFDEDALLRLAASLERPQEHPISGALLSAAQERQIDLGDVQELRTAVGRGLTGVVDGRRLLLGSRALLVQHGVDVRALAESSEALGCEGYLVLHLAVDGYAAGLIALGDAIRPGTADAVEALHAEGVRIVMLTGDGRHTAQFVASQLGIDDVVAEVLPLEKVDAVRRLQGEGRIVAMAGRGLADVQALAQAQLGIALGSDGDIALERAEIILVRGDLRGIARARRLARQTVANARQNLWFALAYNAAAVPLSAALLLDPMLAAALMSASCVCVIGNAIRLRNAAI